MKYFEKHELNVNVISLQWNPKEVRGKRTADRDRGGLHQGYQH
ncbi:hypothetical protein DP57_5929 [Burkholderia pseudomallei]|nr:hypothetical protein DP57_5929 [Burkholderia pseudomallei]